MALWSSHQRWCEFSATSGVAEPAVASSLDCLATAKMSALPTRAACQAGTHKRAGRVPSVPPPIERNVGMPLIFPAGNLSASFRYTTKICDRAALGKKTQCRVCEKNLFRCPSCGNNTDKTDIKFSPVRDPCGHSCACQNVSLVSSARGGREYGGIKKHTQGWVYERDGTLSTPPHPSQLKALATWSARRARRRGRTLNPVSLSSPPGLHVLQTVAGGKRRSTFIVSQTP
jgi:hypothetical protein